METMEEHPEALKGVSVTINTSWRLLLGSSGLPLFSSSLRQRSLSHGQAPDPSSLYHILFFFLRQSFAQDAFHHSQSRRAGRGLHGH